MKHLIVANVQDCSSCGGEHRNIVFRAFTNPEDEYGYYGYCPNTGDLIETEEIKDENV